MITLSVAEAAFVKYLGLTAFAIVAVGSVVLATRQNDASLAQEFQQVISASLNTFSSRPYVTGGAQYITDRIVNNEAAPANWSQYSGTIGHYTTSGEEIWGLQWTGTYLVASLMNLSEARCKSVLSQIGPQQRLVGVNAGDAQLTSLTSAAVMLSSDPIYERKARIAETGNSRCGSRIVLLFT